MEGSSRLGLRERKKLRTRETIAAVAMEMFDRNGFQGTTIPQIAEAADVSPRTVSTYFPSKEEIVFETWADQAENLEQALRDRGPGESTTDALRLWLLGERQVWERRRTELEQQRRVIDSDEGLKAIEHSRHHQFSEMLAASIAIDVGVDAQSLEPRLAAAAMVAVFDVLNDERFRLSPSGSPDFDFQLKILDQGLAFVAGGVDALRRLRAGG